MLDKPNLATGNTTCPTIKHRRVPFKPYRNFKERIVAEVLVANPLRHHECAETKDDMSNVLEHVCKQRRRREDEETRNVRRKV